MKLLKVTISNIDGSFTWLFEQDAITRSVPVRQCVEKALADLVRDHGFFSDNQIRTGIPSAATPYCAPNGCDGIYGILLMPGDEDELDYVLHHENTYWIFVTEYETGTCIASRG